MTTYLHPAVIARAQALGLKARTIVEGLRVGDHKSPYRGFSVEFVQHREYVPGDDTRHIDWKSYGRSERYTIKQYEQEKIGRASCRERVENRREDKPTKKK